MKHVRAVVVLMALCRVALAAGAEGEWATEFRQRMDWWSLRPLSNVRPPSVRNPAWPRTPVDLFVAASLDAAQLAPAPVAEPELLLRRCAFVLTGLPPMPEQRDRFLQEWRDDPATAYERLVDRLLASPHFGEHFARHWMDVVRYTDTYGYESDNPANGAWEYRDYLTRAFNQDVGFDQLVREHIAGDLLVEPRVNRAMALNESAIGPMFYHLGEHREGGSLMFNGIHQQMVDNKIDAFSKAFLATTVACARCHEHKFEAVAQREYFALAAVFMTPRWTSRVIDLPDKHVPAIGTLINLREEIRRELAATWLAATMADENWAAERLKQIPDLKPAADGKGPPERKLDDVAYPITRLLRAEGEIAKVWDELAAEWRDARAKRIAANQSFQVLADFQQPRFPDGWVWEGDGMRFGHVVDGTPLVSLTGDELIERLLPRGFHTHALSSKLPGALRMPPQHLVPGNKVSLQLAGGEYGGYLVVQGNGFKSEENGFFKSNDSVWKTFTDANLKNGVAGVTVEFATTALNPNFPPRIGLSQGLPPTDQGFDKRSWLSITGIVTHDSDGVPQDTLDHLAALFAEEAPRTEEEAWRRLGDWLRGAAGRWCRTAPAAGDVRLLNWLLAQKLLPGRAAPTSRLAILVAEYRRVEHSIAFGRTVTGMDEREVRRASYPIEVRGNVDEPGELVPPDFLQMFAGRNGVARSAGSGRLELAESLVLPDHPLTSRVYVNRVWQWVFGTGIVSTPDDFGHLGDKPSHPELLDFLARDFISGGWSTKRLVRRLVLSQTFHQSGAVTEVARQRDPANRLVHHYPTRRLEAESIRDSLLFVAGRLDHTLYGRPIDPPRMAEDKVNKRLFSGPLDGHGRRSLYLRMSIMEPPKFLVVFNLPDLKLPTGRRDVTNVPSQSLTMLNDPLLLAMAKLWGAQVITLPHNSVEERLSAMFVQALGREPGREELARWTAAVRDFAADGGDNLLTDEVAWQRVAHALFNAKEFIFYR